MKVLILTISLILSWSHSAKADACFPVPGFGLPVLTGLMSGMHKLCTDKITLADKCKCLQNMFHHKYEAEYAKSCETAKEQNIKKGLEIYKFINYDLSLFEMNYDNKGFKKNLDRNQMKRCDAETMKVMQKDFRVVGEFIAKNVGVSLGSASVKVNEVLNKDILTNEKNSTPTQAGVQFVEKIHGRLEESEKTWADEGGENCITYQQFLISSSEPTSADLKQIEQWELNKIFNKDGNINFQGESFKKFVTDNKDIVSKIYRNPLILRQITTDGDGLKNILTDLKDFAKANSGKKEKSLTKNYHEFVNKRNGPGVIENGQQKLCSGLVKAFDSTYNQDCDDVGHDSSDELVTQIGKDLYSCNNQQEVKKVVAKEDWIIGALGAELDKARKDYQTEIDKECPNYPALLQSTIDRECANLTPEKQQECISNFKNPDSDQRKDVIKAYRKYNPKYNEYFKHHLSHIEVDTELASISVSKEKQDKGYQTRMRDIFRDNIADIFSGDTMTNSKMNTESYNNYVLARENEYNQQASQFSSTDYQEYSQQDNYVENLNPQQVIPPFLDSPKTVEQPFAPADIKTVKDVENFVANSDRVKDSEVKKEIIEKSEEVLAQSAESSQQFKDLEKKLKNMEEEIRLAEAKNESDAKSNESIEDNQDRSPASFNSGRTIGGIDNTHVTSIGKFSGEFQNSNSGAASSNTIKAQNAKKNESGTGSVNDAMLKAQESKAGGVDVSAISLIASPVGASEIKSPNGVVVDNALVSSAASFGEISTNPEKLKSYIANELKDLKGKTIVAIQCRGEGCSSTRNEMYLQVERINNQLIIRSIGQDVKVTRNSRFQDLSNIMKSVN